MCQFPFTHIGKSKTKERARRREREEVLTKKKAHLVNFPRASSTSSVFCPETLTQFITVSTEITVPVASATASKTPTLAGRIDEGPIRPKQPRSPCCEVQILQTRVIEWRMNSSSEEESKEMRSPVGTSFGWSSSLFFLF